MYIYKLETLKPGTTNTFPLLLLLYLLIGPYTHRIGLKRLGKMCFRHSLFLLNRFNSLRQSPDDARFKLCVVQFKVASHPNGGSDKGPDGNRIDSIPIANGIIAAGGACDLLLFDADNAGAWFASVDGKYDAFIVRINPGQLSQGTPTGTQAKFDDFMKLQVANGKLVWSSPEVQTKMGAKDALCKIANMGCGLVDTFAYYDAAELEAQFKKTAAFQPRVIKQVGGRVCGHGLACVGWRSLLLSSYSLNGLAFWLTQGCFAQLWKKLYVMIRVPSWCSFFSLA